MVHGDGAQAESQFAEALELRRRHGDDRRLVEPLIDRAWLALVSGHGGEAQRRFLDSLELARRVGDRFIEGEALAGLSAAAGREGRWEACALLAGASAAVYRQIGAPPWESVDLMHERERTAAREALGAARFDARFDEGRALSPDAAVTRAQEELIPTLFVAPHGLGY
jgi:hypothetical protein